MGANRTERRDLRAVGMHAPALAGRRLQRPGQRQGLGLEVNLALLTSSEHKQSEKETQSESAHLKGDVEQLRMQLLVLLRWGYQPPCRSGIALGILLVPGSRSLGVHCAFACDRREP